MSREQLIKIASNYASEHGWNVTAYLVKEVKTKGPECSVSFTGKSKRPGDHFTVYLECTKGTVLRLMPGR